MNLDDLSAQINQNHLHVTQRLTAIETTMENNHQAYGDIPKRVASLERAVSWVKGVGAVCGVAWTGLLAFVEFRKR